MHRDRTVEHHCAKSDGKALWCTTLVLKTYVRVLVASIILASTVAKPGYVAAMVTNEALEGDQMIYVDKN